MLEESEARRRILDSVDTGAMIWVPLELALDQALAQDIRGVLDSPPFDNSEMDGYAVRAEEAGTGAALRVVGDAHYAGAAPGEALGEGEARRIFTGAILPEGADAVVMQEDVEAREGGLRIKEGVVSGEHIRRRGSDVCAGQRLLERGETVTPARIGLLASQGIPEVPVFARPLVQIVTTGDELVEPGSPLFPGEIYNSNAPMLQTAVVRAGGIAATSHAPDHPEDLRRGLEAALSATDFLVVAGGVSVGEKDLVKETLASLGVETEFWRIRLRPGKPFLFGRHPSGAIVFGLPGNPVSALVTFALFVAPAIRKRMGFPEEEDPFRRIDGVAGEALSNPGNRPHYLRGIHRDGVFALSGVQQAHAIHGLSRANCLIRLDAGEKVPRGAPLTAIEF